MRSGPLVLIAILWQNLAAQEARKSSEEQQPPKVEEVVVVTASRTEQFLHQAPAAVSVITDEDLEALPSDDFGDVLRNVGGINVSELGARDVQIASRTSAGTLTTSQLVLLDGRSLYLDFFGFVMWDFLPVTREEVKQIEVVRGPASAVWGANALSGVIHVITKRPREMDGTAVTIGAGEIGTVLGSVTHADVVGSLSYKISASYYQQDAFERPTGLVPGTTTRYPLFENEGTVQPKADLRVDRELSEGSYVSFSGGYAGTDGLIHTGIGPFDIEKGSSLSYLKGDWFRGPLRATIFANFLDADSTGLLARGPDDRPLSFAFVTNTYNADLSSTTVLADRHVITYGAGARTSDFDLSIARRGSVRSEWGAFLQDEVLWGKARWTVGARVDEFGGIGVIISPRTSFLFSPRANHTMRLSFGRAYRVPSLVNNYLDTSIVSSVPLPTGTFAFSTQAFGNEKLDEEKLDAYEAGYLWTVAGRGTLTVSLYRNVKRDSVDFYPASFYTASDPPSGWPLPPALLDLPPLRNALPSAFSYRNVGQVVHRGFEVSFQGRPAGRWSWFANYSYQADPEVQGISHQEAHQRPPRHLLNAGGSYDRGSYFVSATVNGQDEAFWTDVLDSRYWGPTKSFTCVNVAAGIRMNDRATLSVTATNLLDVAIQQHVFGDIIPRKIFGQLQFRF